MARYFAIRIGRAVLTIVLVVTFAFVVLRLSGDPALMIMGPEAPPEVIAAFRKAWGLDDPIWMQYFDYFGAIAKGELGRSMRDGRPAIALVLERIPATLALTMPALLLKVGIGIPARHLRGAASRHRDRPRGDDRRPWPALPCRVSCLALLLVLVFAVQLGWLPSGGQDSWRHAILPIVTLGIGGAAVLARFTRSAMLEVLGQPYIRTASAKGVSWRAVVTVHALPNAAIPTVTIIGFMVGTLIAGAVVVESVFSWPGRRAPAGRRRRQPRSRRRAMHPAAGRGDHGDLELDRRFPLWLPRSAPRTGKRRGRTDMADLSLTETQAWRNERFHGRAIPPVVAVAILWVVAMLVVAIFAEMIAPYSFTKMDLRNRLSVPGDAAHWLGTDELGRDVLSRLIFSIRISLLIAFGATAISAIVGTLLGFLAAHFRGLVEQAVLMLADFQASMPFLILALAVLAFFGNFAATAYRADGIVSAGNATPASPGGLAISANAQGYASAVSAARRDAVADLSCVISFPTSRRR